MLKERLVRSLSLGAHSPKSSERSTYSGVTTETTEVKGTIAGVKGGEHYR